MSFYKKAAAFLVFEKVLYCFKYMEGVEMTWNTKGQKRTTYYWKYF